MMSITLAYRQGKDPPPKERDFTDFNFSHAFVMRGHSRKATTSIALAFRCFGIQTGQNPPAKDRDFTDSSFCSCCPQTTWSSEEDHDLDCFGIQTRQIDHRHTGGRIAKSAVYLASKSARPSFLLSMLADVRVVMPPSQNISEQCA